MRGIENRISNLEDRILLQSEAIRMMGEACLILTKDFQSLKNILQDIYKLTNEN
jgi:hypothetical protein